MTVLSTMPRAVSRSLPHSGVDGDAAEARASFEAWLADLAPLTGATAATLYTTLPRGGLQACHAAGKTVGDDESALAWAGVKEGVAQQGDALAVRVEGPVFGGFPGVLVVHGVTSIDAADRIRQAYASQYVVRPDVPARQLVLSDDALVVPTNADEAFGPVLAAGLRETAHKDADGGRHAVAEADGTRVPVVAVRVEHYPALGGGVATFVSLAPRVEDWQHLRPDDFAADAEMARLTLAVQFIAAEFRRGPTLSEVADAVGLSPFHFHRRFSECFGLTPKHLLYDFQLDEAKRLLADPRRALTEIAETCGFAHQSHFTSRFKQGTGLTPTRWRRHAISA